jgi:hypothetical protein
MKFMNITNMLRATMNTRQNTIVKPQSITKQAIMKKPRITQRSRMAARSGTSRPRCKEARGGARLIGSSFNPVLCHFSLVFEDDLFRLGFTRRSSMPKS